MHPSRKRIERPRVEPDLVPVEYGALRSQHELDLAPPVAAPRPRHRPRWRQGGEKLVSFLVAIFLFVLAIQFMKSGAKALAPDLQGTFPVDNAVSTLGLGWIGACLVLSGSPVAAVALSLFAADVLDELQAFTMLSGSRLGASFIVLLVGFLYAMRSRNRRESTGMGVLALSLTAAVYLPGMVIGYAVLKSGVISGINWTASSDVQGVIDRLWGPLLQVASDYSPGWLLFPIGLGVILVSFKFLDRVLPQIDSDRAARGRLDWLKRPWPMFLLGCLAALLTLSVSVAITVMVPLAAKGYIDRREAMPYIMGANITTLADTLVAAMILGRPEGVQVVLAEAIGVSFVTLLFLAFLYGHLQRAIMRLDEWVVTSGRRMVGFVAVLFVAPGVLLLSGRIVGFGGEVARGGAAELWLSLSVAVLLALPVWAVVDAIGRPERHWERLGRSKLGWIAVLAATAPLGLGFLVALTYLIRVRPLLSVAEVQAAVAVWGDELPI
jgi:solute carrier family 34 (sodium-dependent phosphate cotransporter)